MPIESRDRIMQRIADRKASIKESREILTREANQLIKEVHEAQIAYFEALNTVDEKKLAEMSNSSEPPGGPTGRPLSNPYVVSI